MTIEIADRLIKLRKKYGYSQEEVADKLGLSRQAISKWERAEASPDTDNLICLAKLYNISLDELLKTDEDIDTIVKEQVKREDEPSKTEGVHIVDDEGNELSITDDGIKCKDPQGNNVKFSDIHDRPMVIIAAIEGALFTLTIVGYILLGVFLNMWWNGWVIFFVPGILCSIARAIRKKNAAKFNMVFASCFAFFFTCMVIPGLEANLWHPMWLVFLAIPIYYSLVGTIHKITKKNLDEDDDE